MIEKLDGGLVKLGLDFSDRQKEMLETYIADILECNRTYNLMKADSEDELAVSHILDSLAAVPHLKTIVEKIKTETG